MHITCPECRATLEPDEIDRDLRECPLCSASLSEVDLSAIEAQLGSDDEAIAGNPLPADSHGHDDTTTGDPTRQVEIIERTAERLVVHLPPNASGSGGLGFFALLWNGFMVVFSTIMYFGMLKEKGRIEIFPVVFVAVFWMIGIGLVIGWVRMRFTRLYLLLEKDRLVTQRKLFRTTNRELLLGPASKAVLTESYSVNEVPVHAVTVHGEGRQESFGTGLLPADKEYLTRTINDFLGVETESLFPSASDTVCSGCGVSVTAGQGGTTDDRVLCETCRNQWEHSGSGSLWPPLRAGGSEDLPEGLEVDESDPTRVRIRYPLFPPSRFIGIVRTLGLVFFAVWAGGVIFFVGQSLLRGPVGFDTVKVIFVALLLLFPVLFIGSVVMALAKGKVSISLATDLVTMRWGWGPVAIQKQFLPETITDCRMFRGLSTASTARGASRPVNSPKPFAAIQAGGTPYPLMTFHSVEYGQKVIRVVRTSLEQVTGRRLPD